MIKKVITLVFFLASGLLLRAQDARITQWQQTPLLVNPALAGDFDSGIVRTVFSYANLNSRGHQNSFYNFSIDTRIAKGKWGVGFNGFYSANSDFPLKNAAGLISLSRTLYMDSAKRHSFSLGAQLGFINSTGQLANGGYNDWIDIRAIRNNKRAAGVSAAVSQTVINFNFGANYRYRTETGYIESGFAFYNLQSGVNFVSSRSLIKTKRVRGVLTATMHNQINSFNALQLSILHWKEGMFITAYDPVSDPVLIDETIGQIALKRTNKRISSIGLMSRSFKSLGINLSCLLGSRVIMDLSFEQPVTKRNYFDVQQLGLSIRSISKKRK